jgi:hypothetical protein
MLYQLSYPGKTKLFSEFSDCRSGRSLLVAGL